MGSRVSIYLSFFIVESAIVSISPSAYEVPESASAVNVVVTKTGNFLMSIEGSLTTSFGSAGGKITILQLSGL